MSLHNIGVSSVLISTGGGGSGIYQLLSEKGQPSGYAPLNGSGIIPSSYMPDITISDYLGDFVDLSTALADGSVQSSQKGDWFTVQTDGGNTYIVVSNNPTVPGDVKKISTPTDVVQSVNGYNGVVSLDTDDIPEGVSNLYNQTHTGDVTGATVLTIADEAVTLQKIQHISEDSILGRDSAGTGDVEELTSNTVANMLSQFLSKNSIESDSLQLQLVGDQLSPGNDKIYGTDSSGNKGRYDVPSASLVLYHENPVSPIPSSATGDNAVSIGVNCNASGLSSYAISYDCQASGDYSIAFGNDNTATADYAVSIGGQRVDAQGQYSTSVGGFDNESKGQIATIVGGQSNEANGIQSAILGGYGNFTGVDGRHGGIAGGRQNRVEGWSGFAAGDICTSYSFGEMAMGTYPTIHAAGYNKTSFQSTDRLLQVGNGSFGTRSDAFTILKNAQVGIDIDNFETNTDGNKLQVNGSISAVIPSYATTADAAADSGLPSNGFFKIDNGDGTSALHVKN